MPKEKSILINHFKTQKENEGEEKRKTETEVKIEVKSGNLIKINRSIGTGINHLLRRYNTGGFQSG